MKDNHLASLRIYNQKINNPVFTKPEDVVKYMVAMQAQDYASAKWAIGLRMQNAKEQDIENAINQGKILRTHLLRPTWHFVLPQDIRWLLTLTAPRIHAINASFYKKFGFTDTSFNKTNELLAKALQGNKQLSRPQVLELFKRSGIATDDIKFTIILMRAELDQVICSGARIGKQFSYALLDDLAPASPALTHEEALTKLAAAYFNTRGPATVHDFANWSGLTITDAGIGLENVKEQLVNEVIDGKTYWIPDSPDALLPKKNTTFLLPAYDEFATSYKDRSALIAPEYVEQAGHVVFDPSIIVNNQLVGTWKRSLKKNEVTVDLNLFGRVNKTQTKALEAAEAKYRKFLF
ncbi:winged helix DNA-binding domain-containing protein [Mucilaginibacter sp. SG564]|uniref:winged helix DNA-binding domain-containing protein n=1 Tax=Mucilaginibacter sp. SG564 TaxID=2587022 RepID=UPI001555B625|nr:winged helix DNA-binding domain-containing protein [Mucilaginibacter sp. SG564]NOW93915.1 hypothetical protein [Mucilaginibacter sp. SG564]